MRNSLDTSIIDKPELWRLSLMISYDKIDILARSEVGEPHAVCETIEFDSSIAGIARAIEEIVYASPMLLLPYRKVDILVNGGFSLVVPSSSDIESLDKLFPSNDETITLENILNQDSKIVFRIDKPMYNFLSRTFDKSVPRHSLSVLANYFSNRSRLGNSGKMYIIIEEGHLNVLVYNRLGMAMANGFNYSDINDAAYFALASANTAGFDFTNDEILIAGNSKVRAEIAPLLARFSRNVMPAILPSNALPIAGLSSKTAFPLLILPLCE